MLSKAPAVESQNAFTYALAAALCLLAPVEAFLTGNNYSPLAPEALPLQFGAVVGGILVGGLAKLRWVLPARVALWACVFVAIAFLHALASIRQAALVAVVTGVLLGILRRHAATVVMFAAAVHVVSTIGLHYAQPLFAPHRSPGGVASAQQAARDLPPLVHLVLDEFAGPRGMPAEVPGVAPMMSRLTDRFLALGFQLHTHAYSQYSFTSDSLPNLLNFSSRAANRDLVSGSDDRFVMRVNKYFEHLASLGYSLNVYQSDYLDYCGTAGIPVRSCTRYASNRLEAIADVPIPTAQKARFILNSFLDSSVFLGKVRYAYHAAGERLGIALPPWPAGNSRTGPLAALPTIAALKAALGALRPGEAHFAHLMLPHYPYNLQADCRVKPEVASWLNVAPFEHAGGPGARNDSASRAERYTQYAAQVDCTRITLEELAAAIRASGQWERAVIVVHGDHGSRIVRNMPSMSNSGQLVEDDFRDAYSAFFAVRSGSSTGQLNAEVLPLQVLLARVWQIPATVPAAPQVYSRERNSGEGDLQPIPLRGFGPL